MRVDELRRELHELADGTPPDVEAGRARMQARMRRSRIRFATVVACGMTVVLVLAGIVVHAETDKKVDIAAGQGHGPVPLRDLRTRDAVVVVPAGTSLAQLQAIERSLKVSGNIVRFGRIQITPVRCRAPVWEVDLDSHASIGALQGDLPNTAEAMSTTSAARVFPSLASRHGDLQIFMQVNATAADVSHVFNALKRDRDVESFRYLNHQDAYDEFRQLYANDPSLTRSVAPKDLPASFRVTLRDLARLPALEGRVRSLPGVWKTIRPADAWIRVVSLNLLPEMMRLTHAC
jgi:hypothetical protein